MSHDCQCTEPGFCALLQRHMGQRALEICRRDAPGLTPEECDTYRARWLAAAHPEWFEQPAPTSASSALDCPHRGDEIRRQVCPSCSGNVQVKVHACDLKGECTLADKKLPGVQSCLTCPQLPANRLRFVTMADLVADTHALASQLPPNLAGIIGISRSGLTPASLLAQLRNLPLWILRQDTTPAQRHLATWSGKGDIIPAGNGWRISDRKETKGPLLVVDDTQMTGRSLRRAREVVKRELPDEKVLYAAVYRNPALKDPLDYYAVLLGKPHFLEWNLFNSVHLPHTGFDFDGVLTFDGGNVPQYLPRKGAVTIITGRSEKHRAGSLAWCHHHGVKVKRLVMFPGDTPKDHSIVARYKGEQVRRLGLSYFVESSPSQSKIIAEVSKRPVICPKAGKVF